VALTHLSLLLQCFIFSLKEINNVAEATLAADKKAATMVTVRRRMSPNNGMRARFTLWYFRSDKYT
jgi:hypothetical protein